MRPTLMAQRQLCNTRRPRVTGTSVALGPMELPVHTPRTRQLGVGLGDPAGSDASLYAQTLFLNVVWAS